MVAAHAQRQSIQVVPAVEDSGLETLRKWNDLGLKLFRTGGHALEVALAAADDSVKGIEVVGGALEDRIATFLTSTIRELATRGARLRAQRLTAKPNAAALSDFDERSFSDADVAAVHAAWSVMMQDQHGVFSVDSTPMRWQSKDDHEKKFAASVDEIVAAADLWVRGKLMGLDWEPMRDRIVELVDAVSAGDLGHLDDYAPFLNNEDGEDPDHWHNRAIVALAQKRYAECVTYLGDEYGAYSIKGNLGLDYRLGLIAWLCYRGLDAASVTESA